MLLLLADMEESDIEGDQIALGRKPDLEARLAAGSPRRGEPLRLRQGREGLDWREPVGLRGVHGLQGQKEVLVGSLGLLVFRGSGAASQEEAAGGQEAGGGLLGGIYRLHCACGCPVGTVQVPERAMGSEAQVGDVNPALRGEGTCGSGLGPPAVPRVSSAACSALVDTVRPPLLRLQPAAEQALPLFQVPSAGK